MSYLEFCAGDISPQSFNLWWAFHRLSKPPFPFPPTRHAKARLMNKERRKQTRALFDLFLCYWFFRTCFFTFIPDICLLCLTHLWPPTFPMYPAKKHENHMLSGALSGHKLGTPSAKWDHHWLTQIWPISSFHTPLPLQVTR